MKAVKVVAMSCVLSLASGAWLVAGAQHAGDHMMMSPEDMKWSAVPSLPKGAEITVIEGPLSEAKPFTARLKFPANYRIPPHFHPAIEHVTVISGKFHMGVGDRFDAGKGHGLATGGVAIMQAGVHHYAWTEEPTIVQVHGVGPWGVTYVNPEDDPRKKTQ